jgi:hypothetical protein
MYQAIFIINGTEYVKEIDAKTDELAKRDFLQLWNKRRPARGHAQGWLMKEWNECIRQVDELGGL